MIVKVISEPLRRLTFLHFPTIMKRDKEIRGPISLWESEAFYSSLHMNLSLCRRVVKNDYQLL